jgi:hypothetical protein
VDLCLGPSGTKLSERGPQMIDCAGTFLARTEASHVGRARTRDGTRGLALAVNVEGLLSRSCIHRERYKPTNCATSSSCSSGSG